jgi:hypothetical protein
MKKHIVFYLLVLFIFSCKKEKSNDYEKMNSTEHFSIPTNINNLTNIEKNRIGDSLYKIKGKFGVYEVTGQVKENNVRTGWWQAKDLKTKILIAKFEYRIIDNKEFINQFIFYKNGKIDTLKSKFYSLSRNENSIKYKFYTPNQSREIRSEGKLNYKYIFQGKAKNHLECKCVKDKNIFDCELPISKDTDVDNLIILGNFWEMFQLDNGDIGQNDIYISDTLK